MSIRAVTLVSAATTNTVPSTAATSQSTGGRPLRPWAATSNRPMPSGRPRIAPGSAGMTCVMASPARTCCGVAPSASVTAEARLASRTVAKAVKIAVRAARVTSKIVRTVSTCSARVKFGFDKPARAPEVRELLVDAGVDGERGDETHDGDGDARRAEDGAPWPAGDQAQAEKS